MNEDESAARDIAVYGFLRAFQRDGALDANELAVLERLALRDGKIDDDECAILSRLFARVTEDATDPVVWAELVAFKAAHGID